MVIIYCEILYKLFVFVFSVFIYIIGRFKQIYIFQIFIVFIIYIVIKQIQVYIVVFYKIIDSYENEVNDIDKCVLFLIYVRKYIYFDSVK